MRRDRPGENVVGVVDGEVYDPIGSSVTIDLEPVEAAVGVRVPGGEDFRIVVVLLDLEKDFLVMRVT